MVESPAGVQAHSPEQKRILIIRDFTAASFSRVAVGLTNQQPWVVLPPAPSYLHDQTGRPANRLLGSGRLSPEGLPLGSVSAFHIFQHICQIPASHSAPEPTFLAKNPGKSSHSRRRPGGTVWITSGDIGPSEFSVLRIQVGHWRRMWVSSIG